MRQGGPLNTFGNFIVLGHDADLVSQRNGQAEIYWAPRETWGGSRGARAWFLRAVVLSVTRSGSNSVVAIRFVGQWSVDGRTWNDFVEQVDGRDGLTSAVETGNIDFQYTGQPEEHAAFVRFGIEVSDTRAGTSDAAQVQVRLSADITAQPFISAYGIGIVTSSSTLTQGQQAGRTLRTNAYKSGIFTCKPATASGSNVLTLQGSTDGSNWYSLGTFSFSDTTFLAPITVTNLPDYVRLWATTISSATADVKASLRPE